MLHGRRGLLILCGVACVSGEIKHGLPPDLPLPSMQVLQRWHDFGGKDGFRQISVNHAHGSVGLMKLVCLRGKWRMLHLQG